MNTVDTAIGMGIHQKITSMKTLTENDVKSAKYWLWTTSWRIVHCGVHCDGDGELLRKNA